MLEIALHTIPTNSVAVSESMSDHQTITTLPRSQPAANGAADSKEQIRAPSSHLDEIDRAKGLAIILVVLGHIVAREPPLGNEWYVTLKSVIYSFHMPFFMYLGGVVFFHSGHAVNPRPNYWQYLSRRAERLLVPFVLVGLLILCAKLFAARFVHVDNNPDSFPRGLIALVWDTGHSPATSVWYIFVLFCYCIATPPLLKILRGWIWPLLIVALILHLIQAPEYIYLDRLGYFYVYFVVGMIVGKHFNAAASMIDRAFPVFALLFIGALGLVTLGVQPAVSIELSSLLSLPALHGLMRRGPFNRSRILLWLGGYAFVIYLFNTLLIGGAKGVMLKALPWDGVNFLLFVPALMAAGLVGPIVLKYFVLRRIPVLDRMTT